MRATLLLLALVCGPALAAEPRVVFREDFEQFDKKNWD